MGSGTVRTAVVAAAVMTVFAGCETGSGDPAKPAADTTSGSPSASAAPAKKYTAGQLKKALIKPPAGAMAIRTGSGSWNKVLAKYVGGDEAELTEIKPACDSISHADLKKLVSTPSAFVSFAQIERSSSVLLVGIPSAEAKQAAIGPVPEACRTTKAEVGGSTLTTKVVSDEAFDLGDGGRIVRTDQTGGGVRLRTWQITFAGPGYLAMTDITGNGSVTRADAERLARQAYRKASSTLK
jgi:hypothetical protein